MSIAVEGIGLSSQFVGCANGSKRKLDHLSSSWCSVSSVSLPDPLSKTVEACDICICYVVDKPRVQLMVCAESDPMIPISGGLFGSCIHDSMMDSSLRSTEKILKFILLESLRSFQVLSCSGKV